MTKTTLYLVRHPDGPFSIAPAGKHTHTLDISSPQFDTEAWWDENLVILLNAHFQDGEVQMMHYHPGRLSEIGHVALDVADFLIRVGLFRAASKAATGKGASMSAANQWGIVAKSGVYGFRDKNQFVEHLKDIKYFPEAGYYIDKELVIRGKLHGGKK